MVREALTALISAESDYKIVTGDLPLSIHQVCENRRKQAKVFMDSLLLSPLKDKIVSGSDGDTRHVSEAIKIGSTIASWSDISIIFDFF